MRIALILAAAALALTACGKPPEPPAGGAASTSPSWIEKNSFATDWIPVGRDSTGTIISYSPKTITRDPAAKTADIWLQLKYQYPNIYQSADSTTARTLQYTLERVQFRFRCATSQVATVERRLMQDDKIAAETLSTPPAVESDWRDVQSGGMAALVEGPACRSQ